MLLKIIALAIAGLASTAAFAQTNVTVYGVADAGLYWRHSSIGQDTLGFATGGLAGNRLGFKGTEDLGNGLKAVFVLEQGFNLNDGSEYTAGSQFQRQAFVGLSSNAGTISFGRQYAPGFYASADYDAIAASPVLSAQQLMSTATGSKIIAGSAARWNNTVNYATPNFGGFTGQVMYAAGGQTNNVGTGDAWGLGAKFASGPFAVSYVFEDYSTVGANPAAAFGGTANSIARTSEHFLGGSFDATVVKVLASAQMLDANENRRTAVTNSGRGKASVQYSLGMIVPVGKGNIHANWSMADAQFNGKNNPAGTAQAYGVAYTHPLSKRTTLYVGAAYVDMSYAANGLASAGGANTHTLMTSGAPVNQVAVGAAGDTTTVAFGMNHQF